VLRTEPAAGRPPLPDWLRGLYPFEPKRHMCGPAGLSYVDAGPRSDEAVLLLHGNPTWSFMYRELIPALVAAGGRCIAPDHVGMGLSDKPQDYPYRLATHVANLESLVAALGLRRVHLVVHDWGGAIGFGWAARHAALVGRIALLNTAAFPSPRIPLRIRVCRTPLLGALGVRGFNAFARAATRMTVHRRPLAPAVRRGFLYPYGSWANRVAIHRFVQDIPLSGAHPSMAALAEAARGLAQFRSHAVLIAWGGADFCFTKHFFNRWLEFLPQSEAHLLPDAGHFLLEDAGDEVIPRINAFFGSPV